MLEETSSEILILASQRPDGRIIVFLRFSSDVSSCRVLEFLCFAKRQVKIFKELPSPRFEELNCVHTFETKGHQSLSNSSLGISIYFYIEKKVPFFIRSEARDGSG